MIKLDKNQTLFLLGGAAVFFVGFLFMRRAKLIATARIVAQQTKDFIQSESADSPPPGSDYPDARVVPLYPGSVFEQ